LLMSRKAVIAIDLLASDVSARNANCEAVNMPVPVTAKAMTACVTSQMTLIRRCPAVRRSSSLVVPGGRFSFGTGIATGFAGVFMLANQVKVSSLTRWLTDIGDMANRLYWVSFALGVVCGALLTLAISALMQ